MGAQESGGGQDTAGAIDAASPANPSRIDFNKLHGRSEHMEEAILLLGLATVVLVASAETEKAA
jgi:hypothetical protein